MQSAAKCPFLLTFNCKKYIGPDKDFEERKEKKHRNRFIEMEDEMEDIQKEEIPQKLPVYAGKIVGSRMGKLSNAHIPSSHSDSDILSIENNKIDINDIKMVVSDRK